MNDRLTWRALTAADIPAVAELLAAAEDVDGTGERFDEADLYEELNEGLLDIATDTMAAFDNGTLIGMGVAQVRGLIHDVFTVELLGAVHPDRRGEGVGRGILASQLHRAAVLHAERHPDIPGQVVVRPYDHCRSHVQLVRAAGLAPLRHFFDMERSLAHPAPAVPRLPDGLVVTGYDWARDDEVRRAHNTAFAASFAAVEQDPEGWAQWFTGSRAFQSELSSLVLHRDRVVGFLLSYFYEADARATGDREAWIGQVATLPEYRRQGTGTHLITRALAAYRAAGYSRAVLDVDGESDIGGLAIYSRLGFVVARKRTSFVRQLPVR